MQVYTYRPGPPLTDQVELLWLIEGKRPARQLERVLPTGQMQLMVGPPDGRFRAFDRLTGEPQSWIGGLFCGASSRPVMIDPNGPTSILGARFEPGGALPFLGCSAGELGDLDVALEELWDREAAELSERAQTRGQPALKLRLLERALRRRATRARSPHPAVAWALGEIKDRRALHPFMGGQVQRIADEGFP